jgi:hypothetical protein
LTALLLIVLDVIKLSAVAPKAIAYQGACAMPVKIKAEPFAPTATSDEFFEALAKGNMAAAADVLLCLDGLGRPDLELLSALMRDGPISKTFNGLFPFHIELKRRRPGNPADWVEKKSRNFLIVHAVREAEAKLGKKREAAVAEVMKRFKISRSEVFRALADRPIQPVH